MSTQDRSFVYGQLLNDLIRAVRDETTKVMRKLFARSVAECDARGQPEIVLEAAQLLLLQVPRWPMTKIRRLSTRFLTRTPALRDIVHATLDARISIYKECFGTSISVIPNFSINEFTHTLLINSARRFYTEVYVLGKDTNPAIARRNFNKCLFLIGEAVKDVIEQIVPTRQLINALPQHPTMNRLGVNAPCNSRARQHMLATPESIRTRGSAVLPKSKKNSNNGSSYLVNDTTWLDKQSVNNRPTERDIPPEHHHAEETPTSTTTQPSLEHESPVSTTTQPSLEHHHAEETPMSTTTQPRLEHESPVSTTTQPSLEDIADESTTQPSLEDIADESTTQPRLEYIADESTTQPSLEQDAYVFATHLIENSKGKEEFPLTNDLQPKSPFPL